MGEQVTGGGAAAGGVERTPPGVLVEVGTLADGRAIRFFSWAPAGECPSIGPDRAPGDAWRATRGDDQPAGSAR